MSIILDALKKSESDQQRQSGPALFEVKVAPPKPRFPVWAVVIVALLVINMCIVGYMLLRRSSRGDEAAASGAAPAYQQSASGGANAPGAGAPYGAAGATGGANAPWGGAAGAANGAGRGNGFDQGGVGPGGAGMANGAGMGGGPGGAGMANGAGMGGGPGRAGMANGAGMGGGGPGGAGMANGAGMGGTGQGGMGPANGTAMGGAGQGGIGGNGMGGGPTNSTGWNGAAGSPQGGANQYGPYANQQGPGARAPEQNTGEPTLANRARAAMNADSQPAGNPDDYAPATESDSLFKGHVKRGTESGLMLYQDAAVVPGANLPQLHLDLHVYAGKPQDRFALINMHKMHEGDSLPEGVRVESITPDGVVMSHNGSKFLLPRD